MELNSKLNFKPVPFLEACPVPILSACSFERLKIHVHNFNKFSLLISLYLLHFKISFKIQTGLFVLPFLYRPSARGEYRSIKHVVDVDVFGYFLHFKL